MFCKNCGSQIPDNAPTCPGCSASALAVSPAAVAVDKAKAASKDALQAFKIFASNPVGGLSVAFDALGRPYPERPWRAWHFPATA